MRQGGIRTNLLFTMSDSTRSTAKCSQREFVSCADATGNQNKIGGARRDRTDDLMLAKHALSQLSYGPNLGTGSKNAAKVRWWAR